MKFKRITLFCLFTFAGSAPMNAMQQKLEGWDFDQEEKLPSGQMQPSSPFPAQELPSNSTQKSLSLSILEKDPEYKKLLSQAKDKNEKTNLLLLIKNAYEGDPESTKSLMNTIRTETGLLPLQGAIIGNNLKTVEVLVPFYTNDDIKKALFEAIHYSKTDILSFLIEHYRNVFDSLENGCSFYHNYKEDTPRNHYEDCPLFAAIESCDPATVSLILKNHVPYSPLKDIQCLLTASKLPSIKKILLDTSKERKEDAALREELAVKIRHEKFIREDLCSIQ